MALPTYPLQSRKKLLGLAAETYPGTTNLTSVTGGISAIVENAKMRPRNLASGERRPIGNYGGQIARTSGPREAHLNWTQRLRNGDGFVTTLLLGCGFYNSSGTTYSRANASTGLTGLSAKLWEGHSATVGDGRYKSAIGCMFDATITVPAGGDVTADITGQGIWQAPVDLALPAQSPVANTTCMRGVSTTLTIGGSAIPLTDSIVIALGNQLLWRPSITATGTGLQSAWLGTDWTSTITIQAEAHKLADFDPYAALLAGTVATLSCVITDGTNTITVAAKVQYVDIDDGERNTTLVDALTLHCVNSNGGDDLTFTTG